ncbi:MAG: hypothetical protein K6B67_00020 [Lachnospiraceae bacterium]|nr:hypothetical protein [Lachnospiraceae bacterium]
MEVSGITSYLDQTQNTAASAAKGTSVSKSLSGISSESSEEEITEAVKSFETFLLEQVIKEVRDSLKSDEDDEDPTMSQYKDIYMDATITELASKMVDDYAGTLTEDLVDQVKRNYGIE